MNSISTKNVRNFDGSRLDPLFPIYSRSPMSFTSKPLSIASFFNSSFKAPPEFVLETIEHHLLDPVQDILTRASKNFRAQLVQAGFDLALELEKKNESGEAQREQCKALGTLLEMLHAGSLVIDDIHDNSLLRRGETALHIKYGLSKAMNVGNWMYFWPLVEAHDLKLSSENKLLLFRHLHEVMTCAHLGEAIDIGVTIDQVPRSQVRELCSSSMALKTGSVVGLALASGAILADSTKETRCILENFGQQFGLALQMLDDLSGIYGLLGPTLETRDPTSKAKHLEDIMLRRPGWVWATAATHCSEEEYLEFIHAVQQLPDETLLTSWVKTHPIYQWGKEEAFQFLDKSFEKLQEKVESERISSPAWQTVSRLCTTLKSAYC